jgi:hypothetical protein
MKRLFIKFLIPHELNNFHPHATRHHSILSYALVFALLNYIFLPVLGFRQTPALASNLSGTELIRLANEERKALGLVTLNNNALLANAAAAKANDMFAKQYWDHYGPNGETPWQFIRGAGYNYVVGGENLGKDFQNSIDLHKAWMNSPTHRANIVHPEFRDIGMAIVSGTYKGNPTTFVVQMFGVLPNSPAPAQQPANTPTPKPIVNTPAPKPIVNTPVPTKPRATVKPTNIPVIITATPIPTATPTPEVLNPPQINSPTEGSIFNTKNIKIEGNSESGDTLKVFSNDSFIGELPKGEAAFSINVDLLESSNTLYLKAKNSASGVESPESNRVNLVIDTIKPDLESIDFKASRVGSDLFITITSKEKLERASYLLGEVAGTFFKNETNFSLRLDQNQVKDPIIKVNFVDLAGNVSQKEYDLRKYIIDLESNSGIKPVVLGSTGASLSSRVRNISSSLSSLPARQKFNITFIAVIMLFIAIDNFVLLKKNIKRDHTSYHSFNLSILAIILIGTVSQIL